MKNVYVNKEDHEEQVVRTIFKTIFFLIFLACIAVAFMAATIFFGWDLGFVKGNTVTTTTEAYASSKIHTYEDFTYVFSTEKDDDGIEQKVIKITAYNGEDEIVKIPAEIESIPVTQIGNSCFSKQKMAAVKFPAQISLIESFAFYKCDNLRLIEFEEIKGKDIFIEIKDSAFSDCGQLNVATFPQNAVKIGPIAFQNCSKLTTVEFKSYCYLTIGDQAFKNCNLKKFKLPYNTIKISNGAFKNNRELNELEIPQRCEVGKDITKNERVHNTYNYNTNKTTKKYTTTTTTKPTTTRTSLSSWLSRLDHTTTTTVSAGTTEKETTTEKTTISTTKTTSQTSTTTVTTTKRRGLFNREWGNKTTTTTTVETESVTEPTAAVSSSPN